MRVRDLFPGPERERGIVHSVYGPLIICIGNSMVSRAIWKKHARVSFSKTIKDGQRRSKTTKDDHTITC